VKIAFYAPMKPLDDPTPSGDRQMGLAIVAILFAVYIAVDAWRTPYLTIRKMGVFIVWMILIALNSVMWVVAGMGAKP
jgi:hypothetical protein